jgi:hypothetical protein
VGLQCLRDFVERHAQSVQSAGEQDPVNDVRAVVPVARVGAVRRGHQAAPLVVPHGVHTHARSIGHLADLPQKLLTLVHTPDFIVTASA